MSNLRSWGLTKFICVCTQPRVAANFTKFIANGFAFLFAMGVVLPPPSTLAHELGDGVVERDLQIVVFPDRAEFQYSFEMNLATMRRFHGAFKNAGTLPEDQRQAWDVFRKAIASSLGDKIEVSISGKRCPLKLKSSETIEKHSIKVAHVFVCDFHAGEKSQAIEIHDKNFSDAAGYHRVAIKGRRGVQVEDSTAPVIVSQQLRNAWQKMSKEDREARVHVRASLRLENSKARKLR
ncbi:MAG: hypothetical protein ACE361_04755 [Aureliella sp.]